MEKRIVTLITISTVNKDVNRSKDYLAGMRIDQMHHVQSGFLQTNQNNECVFALVFFEIFYHLFFFKIDLFLH